ncbi:hypothetical protein J3R83DRAFT_5298 [Lanmaoa asiatica]|nr:hypothetical protein J3R83DRAFT_5298 [Lanmaoa asiatica]
MDAHELARWTRFAAKGGIGRGTAIVDCIAQEMGEDLMFLKASLFRFNPYAEQPRGWFPGPRLKPMDGYDVGETEMAWLLTGDNSRFAASLGGTTVDGSWVILE